jgi:hypothetical protein
MTAQRFLVNPFSSEPGACLYRTGDRVRYLANGEIEFLCRIDHQVKLRGFRIELGEIEATLRQHPAVGVAVVMVWGSTESDKRLVAYVVGRPGTELVISDVRKFLRGKLPDYMVPSVFVTMDEMPLTPNEKINRRALPDPDRRQLEDDSGYVAPRTAMEELIAGIWRDDLGGACVGARDNFCDLGGHSLLSMRVVARIEKQTGQRISPREMLFQTLEQLAATCEQKTSLEQPRTPGVIVKKFFNAVGGIFRS